MPFTSSDNISRKINHLQPAENVFEPESAIAGISQLNLGKKKIMSTEAQIQANRANAERSTGPRTEEGKAKSSRNALRCGVYSMARLIPGEDPAELEALTQGILKDLNPLNTQETELANQLIDLQWRLRRVTNREAEILSADEPDYKVLNYISLHGARMQRQYSAIRKNFDALHLISKQNYWEDMETASQIVQANKILDRPTNLRDFGFVFTLDHVERHMALRKLTELTLSKGSQVQHGYQMEPGEQEDLPQAA